MRRKWDLEGIFVLSVGLVMAVLFTIAPFVHTKARTGPTVLEQARSYEQICQTISQEEVLELKGARRC